MLNTAMFSDGSQATLAMVGVAERGGDLDVDVVDRHTGVLIGQPDRDRCDRVDVVIAVLTGSVAP